LPHLFPGLAARAFLSRPFWGLGFATETKLIRVYYPEVPTQ